MTLRSSWSKFYDRRGKNTPLPEGRLLTDDTHSIQAGLRVTSWPVEYSAILQCKPREVIWAHNGIPFEFAS